MTDESLSAALKEAYALAPADEVVLHTLEFRHADFVDQDGNPDSIWVVLNTENIEAPVEDDAPVRAGETVTFVAIQFEMTRPPIEAGATPEIEISVDNVDRRIVENLDRANESPEKIVAVYRCFLASDLEAGSQILPPPDFELSEVKVDLLKCRARARTSIDLRGAFPRMLYTARTHPGLVDR